MLYTINNLAIRRVFAVVFNNLDCPGTVSQVTPRGYNMFPDAEIY